jgi:serine/alanine adding enzyme
MNIQIVDSLDDKVWRAFVDQHPCSNIFHTPEMFQVFEHACGYRPHLHAAVDGDGQVQALLLPVQVTLMNGFLRRLTTRSIAYGGVLYSNSPAGELSLETLVRAYTKNGSREALFTELRNMSDPCAIQPVLSQYGFIYEEHLDYLIDLSVSPGVVLQNIGARTRKHIRQALRKGTVIVEELCEPDLLPVWYELVRKSYTAARVPLADRSLFEAAFRILQPRGMAQFWLARIDSTYVAASVELLYKDVIYGWYSGVDRAYARETPGELLMWRVLEKGSMTGYKIYDFGGAGRPDEAYGVRDFKAKFGGQLVSYGRNLKVNSPNLLRLSEAGYGIYRYLLGRN